MKRKLCILCCIAIIISMVGCTSEKKKQMKNGAIQK